MEYLDFYRTAWPARDGFVVAPFELVVSDFGAVTDRVNERFGTSFARFEATRPVSGGGLALVEEMNRRECGGEVVETHVGRPSAERDGTRRRCAGDGAPTHAGLLVAAEAALRATTSPSADFPGPP